MNKIIPLLFVLCIIILFDFLALCVSPCESTIQVDCSHIFHRVISMKGESTNANCNRK